MLPLLDHDSFLSTGIVYNAMHVKSMVVSSVSGSDQMVVFWLSVCGFLQPSITVLRHNTHFLVVSKIALQPVS